MKFTSWDEWPGKGSVHSKRWGHSKKNEFCPNGFFMLNWAKIKLEFNRKQSWDSEISQKSIFLRQKRPYSHYTDFEPKMLF